MQNFKIASLKILDNIFIVLLSLQLFLLITFYFLVENNFVTAHQEFENIVRIIIMIINALVIIVPRVLYSIIIRKPAITKKTNEKIKRYSIFILFRMLLITVANVINLTAFLLTHNYIYLLIFVIILILFFIYRPLIKNIIKEFNFNLIEKNSAG